MKRCGYEPQGLVSCLRRGIFSDYVTRAKKRPAAGVREASGKVCRKTAQSPDAAHRVAGRRPRDGAERRLLLFGGEKVEKKGGGRAAEQGERRGCLWVRRREKKEPPLEQRGRKTKGGR